ncbi:hypothetical protein [Jeotgalibacillus soli]|uniref:Uncharacterized protein n=1 Tax=Jeotgalibacillus soli TaxID=889306 RepID=A0A0C2R4Y5_9BACL|nr:hypothetical protein [Jeotgalibacillus soli]KIL45330.1 hypothetical protein KP78_28740 [Jeotgalibacillus soli]
MSESIGIQNEHLAPLPKKPNSVSTQTDRSDKKMNHLAFRGSVQELTEKIITIIN